MESLPTNQTAKTRGLKSQTQTTLYQIKDCPSLESSQQFDLNMHLRESRKGKLSFNPSLDMMKIQSVKSDEPVQSHEEQVMCSDPPESKLTKKQIKQNYRKVAFRLPKDAEIAQKHNEMINDVYDILCGLDDLKKQIKKQRKDHSNKL